MSLNKFSRFIPNATIQQYDIYFEITLSYYNYHIFWHTMTTNSGAIMLAVEAVLEADRVVIHEAIVTALEPYYSEADNAIELGYQLVTATVPE